MKKIKNKKPQPLPSNPHPPPMQQMKLTFCATSWRCEGVVEAQWMKWLHMLLQSGVFLAIRPTTVWLGSTSLLFIKFHVVHHHLGVHNLQKVTGAISDDILLSQAAQNQWWGVGGGGGGGRGVGGEWFFFNTTELPFSPPEKRKRHVCLISKFQIKF